MSDMDGRAWPTGDKGLRSNKGKVRVDLISPLAMKGLGEVLTYGMEKYTKHDVDGLVLLTGANNWRKGLSWTETIASLERHLLAFKAGEDLDEESGLPHIDHVMCNVMFLSTFQKTKTGTDDRYKEVE